MHADFIIRFKIHTVDHKTYEPAGYLCIIPGLGWAVVSVSNVVNRREVTAAAFASVTLGWPGGFLVAMVLDSGTAMGCRVVLVAMWAMFVLVMETVCEAVVTWGERGATVAGTDWTVTTGGSGPTEKHRAVYYLLKKQIKLKMSLEGNCVIGKDTNV